MLADRKFIQASQQKAKDVIGLRKVVSDLDIPKELKDKIIFEINKEAGELFESIGVVMNDVMDEVSDSKYLKISNLSQRDFILKVARDANVGSLEEVKSAIVRYANTLSDSPVGLTAEKLKEVAEQKLKVIRTNF